MPFRRGGADKNGCYIPVLCARNSRLRAFLDWTRKTRAVGSFYYDMKPLNDRKIGGARRRLAWPVGLAIGLFTLAGCSERSQEMEERVTQLQRELDRVQSQLNAATQNAAGSGGAAKPADQTGGSASWLSQDTLQETFRAGDAAMRKDLEDNLKGYKVVNSLMQSMPAPADPYPYKSQINLTLLSDQGKNVVLTEVPVKADLNGKWVFPSASEVSQQITARENPEASGTDRTADNSPSAQPAASEPAPRAVMPVDSTVNIQWGDEPAARPAALNGSRPQPGAPRTAGRPAAPPPRNDQPPAATPRPPAMPVSREVEVHF